MNLEEWKKANPNKSLNDFYSENITSSLDSFTAEMLFDFNQQKVTDIRNAIKKNDVALAILLIKEDIPLDNKILDHLNFIQEEYKENKRSDLQGTISDEAKQIIYTKINFSILNILTGIQKGDEKELERIIALSKKSDKLLLELFQLEKTKDELQLSWANSQNSYKVASFIPSHFGQEKVFPSIEEAQTGIIMSVILIAIWFGIVWGFDQAMTFQTDIDIHTPHPSESFSKSPGFFFITVSIIIIIMAVFRCIDFMDSVKTYQKAKVRHQQTLTELDRKIIELKEVLHLKS